MMKKLFFLMPVMALLLACSGDDDHGPSWRDRTDNGHGQEQGHGQEGQNDPNDFGEYPSNSHAYVDLGLSVLWATCNVGATREEQSGGYYYWGDPTGTATLEEMIANDSRITSNYICGTEFDIAHVMWGEKWRLPTPDEREDLIENCTFQWKRVNGVLGALFTSKVKGFEGNSIFLPAAGGVDVDSLVDYGFMGYYMTDELGHDEQGAYVHTLNFDELGVFAHTLDSSPYECWASLDARLTVRPVFGDVPKTNNGSQDGGKKARSKKTVSKGQQTVVRSAEKGFPTQANRRHVGR